jgi:hypothetical protein
MAITASIVNYYRLKAGGLSLALREPDRLKAVG